MNKGAEFTAVWDGLGREGLGQEKTENWGNEDVRANTQPHAWPHARGLWELLFEVQPS